MSKINQGIKILCLHRVSDDIDYAWPPMKVKIFRKLLEYIAKKYEVVSFKELSSGRTHNSKGKQKVILSFDDGYKDFYENALPLLNSFGFPSNHNIISNTVFNGEINWTQDIFSIINFHVNKTYPLVAEAPNGEIIYTNKIDEKNALHAGIVVLNKLFPKPKKERDEIITNIKSKLSNPLVYPEFMNIEEIRSCIQRDVEIGSHTLSHCILSDQEEASVFRKEVQYSKANLEAEFNTTIDILALPNGYYDKEAMKKMVEMKNYKFILTTLSEDYFFQSNEQVNIVPRISLYHNSHYLNMVKVNHIDKYIFQFKERLMSAIKN